MNDQYILDGKTPVIENDLTAWGRWMQANNRIVRQEKIGDVLVSTVFLGMDHAFGESSPLLFETMVFGGPLDQECDRCGTWDWAEKMHETMMERVRAATVID